MSDKTGYIRSNRGYKASRATVLAEDADSGASSTLFKSENAGSENFDEQHGLRDGVRYNVRIKPEDGDIWCKFNSADNDPIFIPTSEVFEQFNIETQNLFLTSAAETTAQIDRIVYVNDVASNHNNTYVRLYARDSVSGAETVYGLWYNVGGAGVQPTDSTVDVWLPVAFAAAATAATIAAAAELVLDAVTGVFTSDDTVPGTLNITHSVAGARTNAVDVGTPDTVSTPTEGAGTDTIVSILVT